MGGKRYNCSMHYIRYDVLYQAVLERLQYWAKAVQQDEEKVLNKIQKTENQVCCVYMQKNII